jgi:alpha-mannosidase
VLMPMMATRLTMSLGTAGAPRTTPARAAGDSLYNGRVAVRIDAATGSVASVRWRGHELVDAPRGGWNRYRYVLGRDTSHARDATRTRVEVLDDGPLVATLRVTSDAPGTVSLVRDISLHAEDDAVRIVTHIDKTKVRDKEAVHLAFPLAVPGGTVRMEQGLAIVRPDSDQAIGANRNLYPVQRWLDASNTTFGVTLVTPDLALWELNGLTAEAFKQADGREDWMRHSLPGTELIAYAMNNYWHTNYKADQPGPVSFRVALIPHGPFDATAATRAGLEESEPLIVLPASSGSVRVPLFTLDNQRVIVSSVTPSVDGAAILVRLWNPNDRTEQAGIQWSVARPTRTWLSSPVEERGTPAPSRTEVPALGVVTLRVERARPP